MRRLVEVCLRGHRPSCTHHSPQARFRPSAKAMKSFDRCITGQDVVNRAPSLRPQRYLRGVERGCLLHKNALLAHQGIMYATLELVAWYITGGAEREDELKKARSDSWLQAGSQTSLSLGLDREQLEIDYRGWSRLNHTHHLICTPCPTDVRY
jgi:hypothetical protein